MQREEERVGSWAGGLPQLEGPRAAVHHQAAVLERCRWGRRCTAVRSTRAEEQEDREPAHPQILRRDAPGVCESRYGAFLIEVSMPSLRILVALIAIPLLSACGDERLNAVKSKAPAVSIDPVEK